MVAITGTILFVPYLSVNSSEGQAPIDLLWLPDETSSKDLKDRVPG